MGEGAGQGGRVSYRVPSWVWWGATGLAIAYLAWENFPNPGETSAKDWRFFYPAAEALVRGTDLYESGEGGYVYPPLLAFLVTPLVPLGFFPSARVWLVMSLAALVAALSLTAREVSQGVAGAGSWRPPRLGPAVLLGLLLSANVARRELEHTQTDWITVMGFVLGLMWMDRRPLLAGAALGLAANVKYHTLIVVPYLLVRGRLKTAGATLGFAAIGALLPATLTGWDRNLEYLGRAFGGLAQFVGVEVPRRADVWGISHLDSISATSALSRLSGALGHGTGLTLVLAGAAAGGCLGLAWWMYRAHRLALWGIVQVLRRPQGSAEGTGVRDHESGSATPGPLVLAAEWAGLIVATVAFSPQTLKRHMFLLVPVYAMTAVLLLAWRAPARAAETGTVGGGRRSPLPGKWVLLTGLVISMLAIFLPPRVESREAMVAASDAWRAVGGPSWGLLVLFFALLWTALEREAGRNRAPVSA